MSSSQSDPYDAVPELFPEDAWEDTCKLVKGSQGFDTVLPPRRPPSEESSPSPDDHDYPGLRIVATPPQRLTEGEAASLEVHEIDGKVVRLEPEKPTQSKVPRHVEFHGKPLVTASEAESMVWGLAKRISLKWAVGSCLGVGALVVVSLSLLPVVNRPNAISPNLKNALILAGDEEATDANEGAYEELVNRVDDAMDLFKKFTTASTREKHLPMVRDRETVEPLILSGHHSVLVARRWDPTADARWEVHEIGDFPFAILHAKLPDYSFTETYFVISDHVLFVDWKASTCYGTATFDELKRGEGDPSEIRGVICPAIYYSHVFQEEEFKSYILTGSNDANPIWCYARRGDAVNKKLTKLLLGGAIRKGSSQSHKVTLRLERGPEESMPNQWLIAEILNDEWISP